MTHRTFSLLAAGLAILLLGVLATLVVEQTELSTSLTNFLFSPAQPQNTRPATGEEACAASFRQCAHNCLRSIFGENGSDRCLELCSPARERCKHKGARFLPTPSPTPAL